MKTDRTIYIAIFNRDPNSLQFEQVEVVQNNKKKKVFFKQCMFLLEENMLSKCKTMRSATEEGNKSVCEGYNKGKHSIIIL